MHGAVIDDTTKNLVNAKPSLTTPAEVAMQGMEAEPGQDKVATLINNFREKKGCRPLVWKVELVVPMPGEGPIIKKANGKPFSSVHSPAEGLQLESLISNESLGK